MGPESRQHKRSGDEAPHDHGRGADRPQFMDFKTWRLADVLALMLLVFNLGVTLTRLNALEDWKREHVAEHKAKEVSQRADERAAEADLLKLRERVVALESAVMANTSLWKEALENVKLRMVEVRPR